MLREVSLAWYAGHAPDYEENLIQRLFYQSHAAMGQALKLLQPQPHESWLELGTGTGLVGREVRNIGFQGRLVGSDHSRNMLQFVPGNIYDLLVQCDATRPLPFADQTFHKIFAAGLFEHIMAPSMLFDQVVPVLQQNGWLLLTYFPLPDEATIPVDLENNLVRHHPNLIRRSLQTAGFSIFQEINYRAYMLFGEWATHTLVLAENIRE